VAATLERFFLVAVFAVGFVVDAVDPVEDDCPIAARGETQKQISARAQPAPKKIRTLASCFRFGSKGNPHTLERATTTSQNHTKTTARLKLAF
jgi:hypothetical protein